MVEIYTKSTSRYYGITNAFVWSFCIAGWTSQLIGVGIENGTLERFGIYAASVSLGYLVGVSVTNGWYKRNSELEMKLLDNKK